MILRNLAHDPRAVSDLRWYWGEADGAMGRRSNFEPMRARLETGGRTGGAPIMEIDERCIEAATRERHIRRALGCLTEQDHKILHSAFGRGERDLPAFGRATGVVTNTLSALKAWQESKTKKPIEEWVARMVCRAVKDETSARIVSAVRREADAAVGAALARFSSARRRR